MPNDLDRVSFHDPQMDRNTGLGQCAQPLNPITFYARTTPRFAH